MFQIVCVNQGNYCGRGRAYVEALHVAVAANMPADATFTFSCFTDDADPYAAGIVVRPLPSDLKGWFAKLYLFSAGLFPDNARVLFFDLDTLITGKLTPFLGYDGEFALLQDFWRPHGYGSGVIFWRAGYATHVWESFEAASRPDVEGGDQIWIERQLPGADLLQEIFPASITSYKEHCLEALPDDALVVCFHGLPRPHMVTRGWVPMFWRPPDAVTVPRQVVTDEAEFWREQGTGHIVPTVSAAHPEGFDPGPYIRSFFMDCTSVVEAGCGIGRLAPAFTTMFYLGLDINPSALEVARQKNPDRHFQLITESDDYPASDGLFFYTVLLHVNDDALPAMLQNAAGAARRIVIAEIMDRRWRRPGNPPVFNREAEEYIVLLNRLGFAVIANERRPYERYHNETWWAARDTRLTLLAFERVS